MSGQDALFGADFINPLPEGVTPMSFCDTCGEFVAICPVWVRNHPWLAEHQPAILGPAE